MRLQIFVLSCFLSFGFSEKLSKIEDEQRAKTCGRIPNQNAKTNDELSPWTVRVVDKFFHAAILISKRHVLTSSSTLIKRGKKEDRWTWGSGGPNVDMTKCENEQMEVPPDSITVDLVACNNHFLCPWRPKVPIKSALYLGPCDSKNIPKGIIVVEMAKDIPEDSVYYIPACIPESDLSVAIGEQLMSHKADKDRNINPVIEILPTTIIACSTPSDHLFCGELSKCPDGSTSPLIKRVDGVDTVVGFSVSYNYKCERKTFASVMYYKDQLCALTGICQKTSPGPYAPKQIPPPTEISLSNKFNKLTSSELSEYSKTCGRPTISGSSLPIDLTPWSVNVITQESIGTIYHPATLISKRHVVVAAFAFFMEKPAKYFDETAVDMSKCQNNVMEIPTEIIKKASVDLSTCNDASKCGSRLSKQVKSAVYFGTCEPEVRGFGVILLEMDSDLPASLPYFVPNCIPEKKLPEVGDSLHLHSIGQDKNRQPTRRISEAKTVKCTEGNLMYCEICATQTDCNKHSYGGFSRTQNGREVLIGVMYYFDDTCEVESLVSMEVLSDLFCLYAGICAEKSSVPGTVPSMPATSGNVPVKTTPSKPDPSTEKVEDQDTVTTVPADSSTDDATTQEDDKVIDQKPEDEITPEAVQPTDKPEEPETTESAEPTDGDETTVEDNTPTEKPEEPEKTEPGDDDDDEGPEEIPKENPKEVQNPEKQVQNPRKPPKVDEEEDEEEEEDYGEEEENEHKTTTAIPSSGAMIRSSGIVVSLICVIFGF